MNEILTRILGINYRTSVLGIGAIVAAVTRVIAAWKVKDFTAMAEDVQLISETVGLLLAGVGLLIAKDAKVTGVGTQAKSVDSTGHLTNIEGEAVGRQPLAPPAPTIPTIKGD